MADEASIRMNRATRGLGEAYILLLLLAWNDVVTNGSKQSTAQIEQSIKVRAADWVKELFDSYKYIPIKDATAESIMAQVEKDSGVQMLRKAKDAVAFIINVLNPAWKDPVAYASGTQLGDALSVCKEAAWQRNEEEKKKQAAKRKVDYQPRPFDPSWQIKEWLSFRYVGVPSGRSCVDICEKRTYLYMRETNSLANVHLNRTKCLQVLKTLPPGSGPSKTKEVLPALSSESLRSAMAATGGRNQRRLANLKTFVQALLYQIAKNTVRNSKSTSE